MSDAMQQANPPALRRRCGCAVRRTRRNPRDMAPLRVVSVVPEPMHLHRPRQSAAAMCWQIMCWQMLTIMSRCRAFLQMVSRASPLTSTPTCPAPAGACPPSLATWRVLLAQQAWAQPAWKAVWRTRPLPLTVRWRLPPSPTGPAVDRPLCTCLAAEGPTTYGRVPRCQQ